MKNKTYWKERQFTDKLINLLPTAIFWKDCKGVFLGCNQRFADFAELNSPQEIIGKTDYDLPWGKKQADLYRFDDEEVLRLKTAKSNIEEELTLSDGTTLFLLTHKSPLFSESGQLMGILGIFYDITNLKNIEKELKVAKEKAELASLAKTEFLENMRHDIRTPLTGIVGFADILKMESDTPQLKEYADNLVASSHALLHLLDDVLEAIRVNSGEIPQLKRKFNLQATLQHIIDLNRAKAAHKRLVLTLDFDATIPRYVIGDKIRLHRVFLELIANALNFTDSGFVKLTALLAQRNHRELIIKFRVEDSGMGIPKDKQQEIYIQFKRLTPSYQGIYKGAGLGLSVVKQFIDELQGEIYLESEAKKGARFTCLLPLQEPLLNDAFGIDEDVEIVFDKPYERTYTEQMKVSQNKPGKKQCLVLVVEDNPIAQSVAKFILTHLNCEVDVAENGQKAIELWKTKSYDLIFMDIGLPDSDGYEITHQIRIQELSKKTHVPIIALTAHAGEENKKRCIEAGMNAVLTKPLTAKNCTDIVEAFIPGRHKENQPENPLYRSELPLQEADLFNLSDFKTLDIEEGVRTTGNDALLAEMLTFMIAESLPADVNQMKAAHDALNWDKTQKLAHKIKGGAVYVGTIRLKMACQYLERYWKTAQHDLLEKLYQQVLTVIDESVQDIKHWLSDR